MEIIRQLLKERIFFIEFLQQRQLRYPCKDPADYNFTKSIQIEAKFESEWKQIACNGKFDYAGLTEFNEPHFKRTVQGQGVFLSLWGKQGKKKWRIGPNVSSKGLFERLLTNSRT